MSKGVYDHSKIRRKPLSQEHKDNIGKINKGSNHPNWKGGLTELHWRNKVWWNNYKRMRRHQKGISKKYLHKYGGPKPLTRRESRLLYKYNMKNAGKLTVKTIQMVYEDNIKKYGTLTCYLCLKSIKFNQDSLEHKIPLCRGGTNLYENLAIAHRRCNNEKYTKTEKEFKEVNFRNGRVTRRSKVAEVRRFT